jgi:hypothetical protein
MNGTQPMELKEQQTLQIFSKMNDFEQLHCKEEVGLPILVTKR